MLFCFVWPTTKMESVCRPLWFPFLLIGCVGSIPVQKGKGCLILVLPLTLKCLFADPLPYWNSRSVASPRGSRSRPQNTLKLNFEAPEHLSQNAVFRADDRYTSPGKGNWLSPEDKGRMASKATGHYSGGPGEILSPQPIHWSQGFAGYPEYGVAYPYAPRKDAEDLEPFFTDSSALMPVYTSSSRSRYQRGRAVFAQTRYTPGDPFYASMPVYSYSQSGEETGPANAPNKGGF